MIKSTLIGHELLVQDIAEQHGQPAVDQFISRFNKACCRLAALEREVQAAIEENEKSFSKQDIDNFTC